MAQIKDFQITRYYKQEINSDKHYHPFYELIYVHSGNLNYFVEDQVIHIDYGNILLIESNTIHNALSHSDSCKYFLINFNSDFVDNLLKDLILSIPKNVVLNIDDNERMYISMIISKLNREYIYTHSFYENAIYFEFNNLLIVLSRMFGNKKIHADTDLSVIEKATKYISGLIYDEKFDELNLESISEKFSMSPSYFSKKFKKETGIVFQTYILMKKIILARELIKTTDLSITDIAYKCGFSDSNYFSTAFKKLEGVPPSFYAKVVRTSDYK